MPPQHPDNPYAGFCTRTRLQIDEAVLRAVKDNLVKAHVPINDIDDNGFTPLMYAATIDFGDDEVLKALLNAGADKSIRNFEGRTPLTQATHYKLSHLEASQR